MPRTIQADGRTFVVPDDATDEEINQIAGPAPTLKSVSTPSIDLRSPIQKSFDENTSYKENAPSLKKLLAGTVNAVGYPFVHPIENLKGLVDSVDLSKSIKTPVRPWDAFEKELPYDIGQVGGGVALGSVMGEAAKPALRSLAPTVADSGIVKPGFLGKLGMSEVPSALSPIERSAVDITKAVNPPLAAWDNYLESAQSQTGNVLDYAKRNNLPINDARDFAKAAKGAAEETRNHYKSQFLDPNADKEVSVTGSGYQGRAYGGGQRATLGDIDSRINSINRDLKSNFRKPTAGQVASAGASDAELEAEHTNLTSILHDSLADLTGTTPEDIKGLRVRGGQLSTLAGETRGAANSISGAAGKLDSGVPSIPISGGGILKEALTMMRGGPEKIASGKLRSALTSALMEPTPLLGRITPNAPEINPRNPIRGDYTSVQTFNASPDSAAIEAQRARLAARQSSVASSRQLDDFLAASKEDLITKNRSTIGKRLQNLQGNK